jgi:GGDEF domain-containing protein
MSEGRIFHVGSDPRVRAALATAWHQPVLPTVAALRAGDVVVIEASGAFAGRTDVPGGNAFSACRAFKEQPGVRVFVVVGNDDPYGDGLARFALADAVLPWDPSRGQLDLEHASPGPRTPPAVLRKVDDLLARIESGMADHGEKASSALHQLLRLEREDTLLTRLQDPETGLFDGPYASLKLDEEFRRAKRFHLPLSLLLLDLGADAVPAAGPERRAVLAEAAAVFLNESRDIDVLARFTATTFLFLLPATPPDGAAALGRRMLTALRQRRLGGDIHLQPSAGLASMPHAAIRDRKGLLAVAEACLIKARAGGGDGGLCVSWE